MSKRLGRIRPAYLAACCAAILCAASVSARERPTLCVLVPHFKDGYWLSVANGIESRAAASGAEIHFFEAGGYRARERQIAQIVACRRQRVDAILIGAVSSDQPALLAAVADAAAEVPVVGLVNELRSDALAARIGVDWHEMGLLLGRHLTALYPVSGVPQRAVLLSGPAESGWAAPLEEGLAAGLAGSAVEIVGVYRGDTGLREQLRLLEAALAEHPEIDIVIGDAPAIEAAMALGAEHPDSRPALAATYMSHDIARGLMGGQILAAPFDDPMEQGSMAVEAALSAIAGRRQAESQGPVIRVIRAGAGGAPIRLSPADYFPTLD